MITETEDKDVRHPEGKLLLMNGNVLDCYPKENQPQTILPDDICLDQSGEYIQIKAKPKKAIGKREREPWEELFFKEAFFLYDHREEIMSDSRMFLTPLPFNNGLAYTGTSGMNKATLGVYLEWWEDCERAVIREKDRVEALTYHIAGSPLSGANNCSAVDREGRTVAIHFSYPFHQIWQSFRRINQRYTEAKQIFQAYTLEETIAKLREASNRFPAGPDSNANKGSAL